MKPTGIVGILLIVIGIVAFAFGGFHFTTEKKVVDFGPLQVKQEQEHTIPFPPILGAICMIGGIVLVFAGGRKAS
jgi:uncharacterized membrane protein